MKKVFLAVTALTLASCNPFHHSCKQIADSGGNGCVLETTVKKDHSPNFSISSAGTHLYGDPILIIDRKKKDFAFIPESGGGSTIVGGTLGGGKKRDRALARLSTESGATGVSTLGKKKDVIQFPTESLLFNHQNLLNHG